MPASTPARSTPAAEPAVSSRRSLPVAILLTLRPHQWVKNLFVVAPLVFSKHLFEHSFALRTALATLAFCALSGAVYAFNDVRDAAADRQHPIKRRRPIAAGDLPEGIALVVAGLLALGAIGGAALLSLPLAGVAAGYLAVNLCYSLWLKQVAFVDVGLIAAGFLLRVLAGTFAIDVPPSPWLLACTGLLAMMLGFGKRAHELLLAARAGKDATATRAALAGYSPTTLRWVLGALALATCLAYAAYTQDHRTVLFFGTRDLVWTLPFPVLGILRFLQLALWRPRPHSPTEAMLRDPLFLLNIAAWGVAVLAIVYV
jgi:decaprenyl-phosphate phosphoribosyltransferase